MESMEIRIENLVASEFNKMKMSNKYSNQARLGDKCKNIVTEEWGFNTPEMWKMIDRYVNKYIPDELD